MRPRLFRPAVSAFCNTFSRGQILPNKRVFCTALSRSSPSEVEVPAKKEGELVRSLPRLADYWEDVHISLETVIDAGLGWIAIQKPCCLSLYNDERYDVRSRLLKLLANPRFSFLREKCGLDEDEVPTLYYPRPLEEGVSGVLLVCFTKEAYDKIKNDEILETCYAIVRQPALTHRTRRRLFSSDIWRVWDVPLSNDRELRRRPAGPVAARRPARTKWRVVSCRLDYALMQLQYHPTAKHQVRRHIAIDQLNVVGDFIYAKVPHPFVTRNGRPRLGMHVGRMKFFPPDRKFHLNLDSALPRDFQNLFPKLEKQKYNIQDP